MQQLRDKAYRVIDRASQQFPERIGDTYEEHKVLLKALMAGDAERAAQLVYEHLENGLRRFLPDR